MSILPYVGLATPFHSAFTQMYVYVVITPLRQPLEQMLPGIVQSGYHLISSLENSGHLGSYDGVYYTTGSAGFMSVRTSGWLVVSGPRVGMATRLPGHHLQ